MAVVSKPLSRRQTGRKVPLQHDSEASIGQLYFVVPFESQHGGRLSRTAFLGETESLDRGQAGNKSEQFLERFYQWRTALRHHPSQVMQHFAGGQSQSAVNIPATMPSFPSTPNGGGKMQRALEWAKVLGPYLVVAGPARRPFPVTAS